MKTTSKESGHWTDEQLTHYFYGVEASDEHLVSCLDCQAKLTQLERVRAASVLSGAEQVRADFLAEQRRAIYAQLDRPPRWFETALVRRWAPTAAVFGLLVTGGVDMYRTRQQPARTEMRTDATDAQLAQEVSSMAFESESSATAPLRGLFVP